MAITTERAIYVDLCTHPALLSATAKGAATGVSIEQAHGDTIVYRIYFRQGDTLVDVPSGFTYSLVAKRQGDWKGDLIISQNTDGDLATLTDTDGDEYLELTLGPTEPLVELFAATKGCPQQIPAKIRLDAEISWNNGGAIRRTRIFPITYTHGVIASGEVFSELNAPAVGISQVTVAAGCELLSGVGTAGNPLQAYHDYDVIEVALGSGIQKFDMSTADYSSLDFTPDAYVALGIVPPNIDVDYVISLGTLAGTFVKFTAKIPSTGWKLRVLARRPCA